MYNKYCDPIGHSEVRGCSIPSKAKWNSGPPTDQSDCWPTLPYNTLQYLTIPTLPYSCNKYCDPIGHSEARGCSIPSKPKWSSGPPTDQSDSWPILPYNTLQYLTIPTLPYSCNKYCDPIGHSEARGCSIPSKPKWSSGPPTDQSDSWPILPYNTLQYLTIPIIPTLPYSCNKYCNSIGHSGARGCSIPSKAKWSSGLPTDQSDSWPTLPYNTLQYLTILYNTLQYLQAKYFTGENNIPIYDILW